jgi:hypothetical protein
MALTVKIRQALLVLVWLGAIPLLADHARLFTRRHGGTKVVPSPPPPPPPTFAPVDVSPPLQIPQFQVLLVLAKFWSS